MYALVNSGEKGNSHSKISNRNGSHTDYDRSKCLPFLKFVVEAGESPLSFVDEPKFVWTRFHDFSTELYNSVDFSDKSDRSDQTSRSGFYADVLSCCYD